MKEIWIKRVIGLMLLLGMIMPQARNVSRAAEEGEYQKPDIVIEFGKKGYWNSDESLGIPLSVGWSLMSRYEGFTKGSYEIDSSGSELQIDIDRDGTFDVAFVSRWITEYGMAREYVVPLPGNSLRKEITITAADEDPFTSVTFKPVTENVKKEYSITVIGGKARTGRMWEDDSQREYRVKAAPGTFLTLECEAPKGKYIKQYQTSDVPMYDDSYFLSHLRNFVMPAHDVTIKVITAPQETGIIETGQSEYYEPIGWDLWVAFCTARGVDADDSGYKDLDGDGTYDISIGGMGSGRDIVPLPYRSVVDEYVVKGENPGLRYNCIVLRLSDGRGAYELDMEELTSHFYENINGENVSFREFFTGFQMPDRPWLYDFDRDGTPDAHYENSVYSLMSVLPTCSLGERYTIPADQLGAWEHPVTLVLKEKPEGHTVTMETGQGGSAELYLQTDQSSYYDYKNYRISEIKDDGQTAVLRISDQRIAFHKFEGNSLCGKMSVYVSVTPDEGYEIDTVTGDENAERLADCLFRVDNADAVITVTFRKLPEPSPTATPTVTPTVTPTPTELPIEEVSPTAVPEEKGTKPIDEKDNSIWIPLLIAGAAVILAGVITAILLLSRKKQPEPETKAEEPEAKTTEPEAEKVEDEAKPDDSEPKADDAETKPDEE